MFFNELDILEIRLHILNEYVDRFVLVECTKTHTGKDKPLYFEENKNRFVDFLDRIIYVKVDDLPTFDGSNSWELENFHRNAIVRGLKNAKDNDVILISDVDEIPNPEKIKIYSKSNEFVIFQQKLFYYYLNCLNKDTLWHGTIMLKYPFQKEIQSYRHWSIVFSNIYDKNKIRSAYYYLKLMKFSLLDHKVKIVKDGGWHFSYMGGLESIIKKIESYAHTEYNNEKYKDLEYLRKTIEQGKDIFERNYTYQFLDNDEILPIYIVQNKDKYRHLYFHR